MSSLMISLIFAGMLVLLYQCAIAVVIDHSMSPGALFQLLILALVAANALKDLSEVWGQIQKASGAAQRIAAMIDTRPIIAAPTRPVALPTPTRGEVSFERVRFAYPGRPDLAALNGFSLHIRPGERVALVGPSGAGKSTVFRLLLRFYDPDFGAVRIDGVDLRGRRSAQGAGTSRPGRSGGAPVLRFSGRQHRVRARRTPRPPRSGLRPGRLRPRVSSMRCQKDSPP